MNFREEMLDVAQTIFINQFALDFHFKTVLDYQKTLIVNFHLNIKEKMTFYMGRFMENKANVL